MSDEERAAILEASRYTQERLGQLEFRQLIDVMVLLRRLYGIARAHLQQLLEVDEARPQLTEDFIVQYTTLLAQQSATHHEILTVLQDALTPWLIEAFELGLAAPSVAVGPPVPVGLPGDFAVVRRDRALVVAGPAAAADRVLALLRQHVAAAADTTLWLGPLADDRPGLFRVPPALWSGAANSHKAALQFIQQIVHPAAPVLVVAPQLDALRDCDYRGRPPGAKAGEAHRILGRLLRSGDIALVGVVASDGLTSGPEFEQLRTFATLVDARLVNDVLTLTIA